MLPWQLKIGEIEEEIKELEIKLWHAHSIKNTEEDYDIKSKIIEKQNQIIAIYIEETEKMLKDKLKINN